MVGHDEGTEKRCPSEAKAGGSDQAAVVWLYLLILHSNV